MTINEILVLMKAIRERINDLKSLRSQVSIKESYFGDRQKVVEPLYDVKLVDKKITELEMWLFKADAGVKQANATVKVDIEANVETLLSPLV
jgi:hypothetical protein